MLLAHSEGRVLPARLVTILTRVAGLLMKRSQFLSKVARFHFSHTTGACPLCQQKKLGMRHYFLDTVFRFCYAALVMNAPSTPPTPRDVTLIHRTNSGSASVVRVVKVGRSYWHGCALWESGEEKGDYTEGYASRWAKADYLLIEGAHWDLVQQIRTCHFQHQDTVKRQAVERDDAKREMIREWEDRWSDDHPSPRRESIEEIVERWRAAREIG